MIKKLFMFLISLTLTGCFSPSRSIQKIYYNVETFQRLEKIILDEVKPFKQNSTCNHVLVVLDIDCTLLQHGIYHSVTRKLHKMMRENKITPEEDQYLTSVAVLDHEIRVLDKGLPGLVHNLQKKGIKTICITNTHIEKFGKIDDLIPFRIEQLLSVDKRFNFTKQFPEYDDELRAPLAIMHNDHMEEFEFYKGVLYANKISHKIHVESTSYKTTLRQKGLILDCFLNELYREIGWKPAKIIFVDNDNKSQSTPFISAVYDAMKYKNIDLTAIQYTQLKTLVNERHATLSPKEKQLQNEKIEKQLKILLEERRWQHIDDDSFFY